MPVRDSDYEGLDDREFPDPDQHPEHDVDTIDCPHCRAPVYEDAEQCPSCGSYLTAESPAPGKPLWIIAITLLLLVVLILLWIF